MMNKRKVHAKYETEEERQAAVKRAKRAWYDRNRKAYLAKQAADRRAKFGPPRKPGPAPGPVPAQLPGRKPNPAYHRLYAQRNAEAFTRRAMKAYFITRRAALEAYGGTPPTCACCGEAEYAFLALDHIHGNGAEERRTVGRGSRFWYRLKRDNYPPGYQVLCHNCNQGRGRFGPCPHTTQDIALSFGC